MITGFLGDIIGSVYEGRQWIDESLQIVQSLPLDENLAPNILKKDKFIRSSYSWTDDSLCTLALYHSYINNSDPIKSLVYFCKKYESEATGFGKSFRNWLDNPIPYHSFGNGAIMRIGFIPYLDITCEEKISLAYDYTSLSHNHLDSYTSVIDFIILTENLIKYSGKTIEYKKGILKSFLEKYDFNKTVKSMHNDKKFEINSLQTFLQAVRIVYESENETDFLRKSFYIGGDSDTLACVAGNISAFFWPLKKDYNNFVLSKFEGYDDLHSLIVHFNKRYNF